MKDTVIFDLDGTLLDTLDDLTDSMNVILEQFSYPCHTREAICSFVGNGIHRLVELAVPEGTDQEQIEAVFVAFKEYYGAHCLEKTAPYKGIMELLTALKEGGYKVGIVSNKADAPVKTLAKYFFDGYVSTAIGERPMVRKKPAKDTVVEAMKELGSMGETCVYVGDSDVDIQTAKNAEIDCISVTWGFRTKEFLKECGGTVFAEKPMEILPIIKEM